jgi:hypothetical protein
MADGRMTFGTYRVGRVPAQCSPIELQSAMALYYVLAAARTALPTAGDFQWPCEVALSFDGVERPVGVAEGVGHGLAAAFLTATDALNPEWAPHFADANAEWLIPFVQQMAFGELVPAQEVLGLYRARHGGSEPETYAHVEGRRIRRLLG